MTTLARPIEVYADVVCPFAYVGLTRLLQERDRRHAEIPIHVRAWPLEVVNGHPVDPGHIAIEIDDLRRQVAPELFNGFDAAAFPATSLPALALVHAAYDVDATTGETVAIEVRRELFERGRDIADPAVLDALARRHGVLPPHDHAAVMADHAEGVTRGVVGSPHFFVDGWSAFCPVLTIRKDGSQHFHVSIDEAGMDDLLRQCFG